MGIVAVFLTSRTDNSSILRKTFGIKADFLGLLPGRQTYVIDKSGKVSYQAKSLHYRLLMTHDFQC